MVAIAVGISAARVREERALRRRELTTYAARLYCVLDERRHERSLAAGQRAHWRVFEEECAHIDRLCDLAKAAGVRMTAMFAEAERLGREP
jgi:hypothetical protein